MDLSTLPPSFNEFLRINDVDPVIYTVKDLPRFVRWNTRFPKSELPTAEDLQQQLKARKVWPVKGVEGFFGILLGENLPDSESESDTMQNTRIVDIPAYRENKIFGIDLSSGLAVLALQVQPNDHVLDLCCAPGAKLCMISNIIGSEGTGTVTGVDISPHRVATCRSLVKRYKVAERVRLFNADGTTFKVYAPSRLGARVIRQATGDRPDRKRQHITQGQTAESSKPASIKPFYAPKILRFDPQMQGEEYLYDKVIVDAECTHDGSISHILKYQTWGWDAFEKNFMDPDRLRDICQLQQNLIESGWSLLANDGILVYSTCSLSVRQNEENVAWFLHKYGDEVELESIPNIHNVGIKAAPTKAGWTVPGMTDEKKRGLQVSIERCCVRFDPVTSATSGFFVARFRKVPKRLDRKVPTLASTNDGTE
ncbi:S-adenosyl-L-methionine-dependent methyltransferase [Umbelopsis sp. AD052]|nr:S-adenosyl-L-methionine-dependent methyltransferase [Umbelopsis sp. AD052]